MKTAITELLNIDYPIVQGAMAWVADSDLASAVSNAGGLGIVGTGHDPVEVVREKVATMREKTNKPFAVNAMFLNPNIEEVVEYLIEESGVKIVTTGAGNPSKYMNRFKAAGIKVIPVVASVAVAKRMERIGADAIVVEGMEAGGHIGRLTSLALLPQVADAVSIPMIGAGGFGDGRSLSAALMLGAEGIQVGTRFVVAEESNAHDNFKKQILKAKDISTTVTGEITGHPVRVLRNQLTTKYLSVQKSITSDEEPDFSELERLGSGALRRAVIEGDTKDGSMMAGQIAGLVNAKGTVEEIILDYVNEAKRVYENRGRFFEE